MTRSLTVFDTGEVHEPHVDNLQLGWVDFDNDESATEVRLRTLPAESDPNTTVIDVEIFGPEKIELQLDGRTVWAGDVTAAPAAPVTVADLDGTVDEASWVSTGHVLDADDVAYIRSLRIRA